MEITLTTMLKNISEIIKKKQDILNVWASKAQKKTPIMYLVPKMHKNGTGAFFKIELKTCSTKQFSVCVSNVSKLAYSQT